MTEFEGCRMSESRAIRLQNLLGMVKGIPYCENLEIVFRPWCKEATSFSASQPFGKVDKADFEGLLRFVVEKVVRARSWAHDEFIVFIHHGDRKFSKENCFFAIFELFNALQYTAFLKNLDLLEYKHQFGIGCVLSNLGVMYCDNTLYEKAQECFKLAQNCFEQEQDYLGNMAANLNLAALSKVLGHYQQGRQFCLVAFNCLYEYHSEIETSKDLLQVLTRVVHTAEELEVENKKVQNLLNKIIYILSQNTAPLDTELTCLTRQLIIIKLKEKDGKNIPFEELGEFIDAVYGFVKHSDEKHSLPVYFIKAVVTIARIYNDMKEACHLLKEIERVFHQAFGANHQLTGLLLSQIGSFYLGIGQITNADIALHQAVDILVASLGQGHPKVAACQLSLGTCAISKGETREASRLLNEALSAFKRINPEHPQVAETLIKLAEVYAEEGQKTKARETMEQALCIVESVCGEFSFKTAGSFIQAGGILKMAGASTSLAIDATEKAISILSNLKVELSHPDMQLCHSFLGAMQLSMGKTQAAVETLTKALHGGLSKTNIPAVKPENVRAMFKMRCEEGFIPSFLPRLVSLINLVHLTTGDEFDKHFGMLTWWLQEHRPNNLQILDFRGNLFTIISHAVHPCWHNVFLAISLVPTEQKPLTGESWDLVSYPKIFMHGLSQINEHKKHFVFFFVRDVHREVMETECVERAFRESVDILFMLPKFRKVFKSGKPLHLDVTPPSVPSLCQLIDSIPFLVECELLQSYEGSFLHDLPSTCHLAAQNAQKSVKVLYHTFKFSEQNEVQFVFDNIVSELPSDTVLECAHVSLARNVALFHLQDPKNCLVSLVHEEDCIVFKYHLMPGEGNSSSSSSLIIQVVKGIVDSACDLMGVKYDLFAGHNCENYGVNNLQAEDTSSGYSSMEVEGRSVCSIASSKVESDEDSEDNESLNYQQQDGHLLTEKFQLETPALTVGNENANSLELGICISLLESLVARRCRQKEVTRVSGLSDVVKDDNKEVLNSSLLSFGSASSLNSLPEFLVELGDESPTSCTADVVFKDDDCASESRITIDTMCRGIAEESLLKENHAFVTQQLDVKDEVSELRDQVRVLEQQLKYAELEKAETLNELGRHLVYEAREKRRKGITTSCTSCDPYPDLEISQRHTVSSSFMCRRTGKTLLGSWSAGQEENSATQDEIEPCRIEGSFAVIESAHRRFQGTKIRDTALYLTSERHGNDREECFSDFSSENENVPIHEEVENDPLSVSKEKNAKQVSLTPSSCSDDSIQLHADTASSVTAEHVESARLNLRHASGSTANGACHVSAIAESSQSTCGQQFRNLESDKPVEDEIPDPGPKVSEAKDGRINQLIWNADRKRLERSYVDFYGSLQGDMHDPKEVDLSKVQDAQVEDHDTGSPSVVEVQRSNGIRVLPSAEDGMVVGIDSPVMSRVQAESTGDQLGIYVQHSGGTEVPGEVREELTQKCHPQSEESCTASESVCVVHPDRCQVFPSCLPSVASPAPATTKAGEREHGLNNESVGDGQRPKRNAPLWYDTCDGLMKRRILSDDYTESNVTPSRNEGVDGTLSEVSSLKKSSSHEKAAFTCKGNASLKEERSHDVTTVIRTTVTNSTLPAGDGSYAGEASLQGYWHRLGARPRERCSLQGQHTQTEHSSREKESKGETAGLGVANAFLARHSEDENLHHSLQQRSTDERMASELSTFKESDLDTTGTGSSEVQLSCDVESHEAFGDDIPAPVGFPSNRGLQSGCEDSTNLGINPDAHIYTPFQPVYEHSSLNSGRFTRPVEDRVNGSDYPATDHYCPFWNPTNYTASVPVPYGEHITSNSPYYNVGQSDLTSGIFSLSTSRRNPDYTGSYTGASWWHSAILANGAAYDDDTNWGSVESNQLYSSARGSSPMISTDSEQTVTQIVSQDRVEIGTMTDDSVYVDGDFESCAVESPAAADVSLLALEQRVAEACALVERVLREREEREQTAREIERRERELREIREREAREREASSRRDQQEAITGPPQWLCEHYQRHCRVRFSCCEQFYSCHRCHNSSGACSNDEAKANHATHMKCSRCNHVQEINETSQVCANCKRKVSAYFCAICKHFTSVDKNPYHCDKCGICRIHKERSFHCKVCDVCLDKRLLGNHKCRPDSGHDECCICLEDAFSGCQILPCSHKVHRECAVAMIQNGVRNCPICRQSLYTSTSNS